jgi:hypothetical protein
LEGTGKLPKISEFFGISIYMYWREHPPAHFTPDIQAMKS